MPEQEQVDVPRDNAPTSAGEEKRTASAKRSPRTAKKHKQKAASLTDDQKRLARNAALREWRRMHPDRVKSYMAEWRARRMGKEPGRVGRRSAQKDAKAVQSTTPRKRTRPQGGTKKPTSKNARKAGKA